jgi:hypothetical protein
VSWLAIIVMVLLPSCGSIDQSYMKSSSYPDSDSFSFTARLYNLSTGEILRAKFEFEGTTQGKVSFALPSGEMFDGEYQTITGGVTSWGRVYSHVWGSEGIVKVESRPNEYRGSAIATSDEGRVIECEYITNRSRFEPHGQGACKDNRGNVYKLMF